MDFLDLIRGGLTRPDPTMPFLARRRDLTTPPATATRPLDKERAQTTRPAAITPISVKLPMAPMDSRLPRRSALERRFQQAIRFLLDAPMTASWLTANCSCATW